MNGFYLIVLNRGYHHLCGYVLPIIFLQPIGKNDWLKKPVILSIQVPWLAVVLFAINVNG